MARSRRRFEKLIDDRLSRKVRVLRGIVVGFISTVFLCLIAGVVVFSKTYSSGL